MNLKPLVRLNSFSEAQVLRGYLVSCGLNPIFMDESMRTIAPHLELFLGEIRIFIPEVEYDLAIQLLREKRIQSIKSNLIEEDKIDVNFDMGVDPLSALKKLKKLLILSLVILPVLPNLYSLYLIYTFNNDSKLKDIKSKLGLYFFLNLVAASFTIFTFIKMADKSRELMDTLNQMQNVETENY